MQSLETLTERDFDSVWEIMEESFPRDERRSREAQRKILDVSWYHLYGYRAHGELMAFLAVSMREVAIPFSTAVQPIP